MPEGRRDAQYDHALAVLGKADQLAFDLRLFAERHLGHDLAAWVLASAMAPRFENIRPLVAVHPGLWDLVMVAKLAVSLGPHLQKRMAINIVNGRFDEEFRMFGGKLLEGEERYRCRIEFIVIMRGLWPNDTFPYDGGTL